MRLRPLVPLALASLVALTGCGSSSGGAPPSTAPTQEAAAPLASLLPADIAAKKTLVVGSDISYAPVEFKGSDGTTTMGIDPDLAAAIGKELGITLQFQNATFDGLITSLTSKRIDLVMSALSDNKKRQASVDFVDYFNAGTSILVAKGNPKNIMSLDDFCGQTIALQRGTTQEDVAKEQQTKCSAAGKPLKVLAFDTDPEALLQVRQGRAVADMNDFPVAAYTAKQSDKYEVVGEQIEAGPYGIAVRKQDTQLRDALQKAVQAIIDDGTYAQVLAKWDVTQGAVKTAAVNGGT